MNRFKNKMNIVIVSALVIVSSATVISSQHGELNQKVDVEQTVDKSIVSREIVRKIPKTGNSITIEELKEKEEQEAKDILAKEQELIKQAEAEKIASEQAEAERVSNEQAEAERAANEQAEAERIKLEKEKEASKPKLTNEQVAKLVINGKYGNGESRRQKLESEGYNFRAIQDEVVKLTPKVSNNIKPNKNTTSNSNTQSSSSSSSNKQGSTRTMQATAYSTNEPGMGRYTANGTDLQKNSRVIAVDPNVIPLGTMVTIEGYGTYVAADTGGAIKGNRIDIHFNSVQECINFGRRNVNITIHR